MNYKKIDGGIEINNEPDFNIKHILECGQIFRYKMVDYGYKVWAGAHEVEVYCHKTTTKLFCKNENFVKNYFDFDNSYANIKMVLDEYDFMREPIEFGSGIRILNQEPIETIISFIISANNNIPRIKKILENLCKAYGTNMGSYNAFPTINQLKEIPYEFFRSIGAGYRASYLVETIKMLANGFDLEAIKSMDTDKARKELMKLKGVGKKVADCVLLFGYHKTDVFPTDTWIVKVYQDHFNSNLQNAKIISNEFKNIFGNYSGYAQQYLYYHKLLSNKKSDKMAK